MDDLLQRSWAGDGWTVERQAFQLRDDLTDHDAAPGISADRVNELVARAIAALEEAPLQREAVRALRSLAELLRPEPS